MAEQSAERAARATQSATARANLRADARMCVEASEQLAEAFGTAVKQASSGNPAEALSILEAVHGQCFGARLIFQTLRRSDERFSELCDATDLSAQTRSTLSDLREALLALPDDVRDRLADLSVRVTHRMLSAEQTREQIFATFRTEARTARAESLRAVVANESGFSRLLERIEEVTARADPELVDYWISEVLPPALWDVLTIDDRHELEQQIKEAEVTPEEGEAARRIYEQFGLLRTLCRESRRRRAGRINSWTVVRDRALYDLERGMPQVDLQVISYGKVVLHTKDDVDDLVRLAGQILQACKGSLGSLDAQGLRCDAEEARLVRKAVRRIRATLVAMEDVLPSEQGTQPQAEQKTANAPAEEEAEDT